jgi:hypothetical protein
MRFPETQASRSARLEGRDYVGALPARSVAGPYLRGAILAPVNLETDGGISPFIGKISGGLWSWIRAQISDDEEYWD